MENGENYKIIIRDVHYSTIGERTESTSTVYGSLAFFDDGYVLSYEEHEGEFADCVTSLRVTTASNPITLNISREGLYRSDLFLEPKKRHTCQYNTPYGSMMLGVLTYKIESDINRSGGTLNFSYCLESGGGMISENQLQINVKEMSNV